MDQSHEVHADQPQVGSGLGDQQVHQAGVVRSVGGRDDCPDYKVISEAQL